MHQAVMAASKEFLMNRQKIVLLFRIYIYAAFCFIQARSCATQLSLLNGVLIFCH